jgi:hypothetical protein
LKLLTKYEPERFTTVEFLPFGFDWTHVAEIRFSENKGLPVDSDPPRRQKVRNSTVEVSSQAENALGPIGWRLAWCMIMLSPTWPTPDERSTMEAVWRFISDRRNRIVLSWLGGGAVVVIGGLWAAFVYFDDKKPPGPCTGGGGVTVSRDVNASIITTNGSGATDWGRSGGKG